MPDCQICGRKTPLYTCHTCNQQLADNLNQLQNHTRADNKLTPSFLEHLEDVRYGRTKIGDSTRRSTDRTTPLPIRLGPHTTWDGSPAQLLTNLHHELAEWVEWVNKHHETLTNPDGEQ